MLIPNLHTLDTQMNDSIFKTKIPLSRPVWCSLTAFTVNVDKKEKKPSPQHLTYVHVQEDVTMPAEQEAPCK